MDRTLTLGKVKGIKISIHWTFLILIVWIIISNFQQQKSGDELVFTLLFILSLFACVILHELGHALTAAGFGLRTQSITLLPIGGVAQMEELPEKPTQELAVAFAGPAVNLIISGILYGIMYLFNLLPNLVDIFFISGENFLFSLFIANIALAVFNLIPAFPMDGGRVLRALLSYRLGRDKGTRIAALTGEIIAIGFVGIGIFYNPVLVFVGIFVYLGARTESSYVHSKSILSDYMVKDMLITKYDTVSSQDTIGAAAKLLLAVQAKDFLVSEGNKITGTLNRDAIIYALSERGGNSLVREAMNQNFISFNLQDTADKVYRETLKTRQSIFPVYENENLIGVVDTDNLTEFLLINEAQRKSNKRNINEPVTLVA